MNGESLSKSPNACSLNLAWSYAPWKDDRLRFSLAILAVISCTALFHYVFNTPIYTLIAFLALTAFLSTRIFPVNYEMTEEGLLIRFLGYKNIKRWKDYRNFYPHREGVFLTTMTKPSWLDPFRGNYIYFNNNRDAVLAEIRQKIRLLG